MHSRRHTKLHYMQINNKEVHVKGEEKRSLYFSEFVYMNSSDLI